jgi:hypothetical protein
MEIYEATNQVQVHVLLEQIHQGLMVLPDFQRDFVWDPSATQGLLVSIANQFPAGSLLRSRDQQRGFAVRRIDGAPDSNHLHTFLVLDGQQRLTSLYQALYGVGEYRYFIDLARAFQNPALDDDDTIYFRRTRSRGTIELENDLLEQSRQLVFPLSVIHKRDGGFWRWRSDIRELLPAEQRDQFEEQTLGLWDQGLKHFHSYPFPVVTLTADVPMEALCTIFETLNRSGVKLTVSELMTARFFQYAINLRLLWEEAEEEFPILKEYEVELYSALQAISLIVTGRCQKRDVLGLTKEQLETNWRLVIESAAKGLRILREDCKVMSRKWLPTPSMLGPLTAICAISERANLRGAAVGARKAQIIRWLWCAMFGQRYEAAANTRAERDVSDMQTWFDGGEAPELLRQFRFDKEILREVATKAGSIYKSVICLTLASEPHAKDFHSGVLISQEMVLTGEVDDHHIFPSAYLEREKGVSKKALRDCVLNRTLIDRTTNQMISDRAPSQYLADIDAHRDTDEILRTHLLPTGPKSPLRADDYEAFLNNRAELISQEIARVTS